MLHQECPTSKHPETPRWYTSGWASFVKIVGEEQANAQRNAFYAGFVDVHGVRWCGHCFFGQQLINVGAQLGYPDLYQFCHLAETKGKEGYEAWLYVASSGGPVLVQWITLAAQARLKSEKEVA